jgi:tRNA-splicing ligase RtcB
MNGYNIKKISDYKWEMEKDESRGMRVPGIIFADRKLLEHAVEERTIEQVINVASLPGILKASYAMPDIHYGYGFPIGGVAATDMDDGVISPGGVGFDISCGVRVLRTNLNSSDIKKNLSSIIHGISVSIPRGVGSRGKILVHGSQMRELLTKGVSWAIKQGYGWEEDKYFMEESGCMEDANPDFVSKQAKNRGSDQVGTLGSGNHFLEIQKVSEIYDNEAAGILGLEKEQVTIMIHSGSRGLGHQVCGDYLKLMQQVSSKYKIELPDRQLGCVPVLSPEGKRYYGAMACAANYAMVNRHCLAHWVRLSLESILKKSARSLDLGLIYDISHNIAKFEMHNVGGKDRKVLVHRKGATRAFGPGHRDILKNYRGIGQPVIIPGDMGSCSYIMLGTEKAAHESFSSTCHGAGRMMSRTKARKRIRGDQLKEELFSKKGIVVVASSMSGLAEEAPEAYKDINNVVNIAHNAGISKKVAKLEPLGVIKG